MRLLLLAAFLAAPAAAPAAAQQTPFGPEDVFDLEWASDVQISPDGQTVAYVRNGMSIMRDRREGRIWTVRADGSRHRKLTSGDQGESQPRWSPDGTRLAFVTGSDDGSEIHVWWADTGVVARLTQLERSPGSLAWSPDGSEIAFTMTVPAAEATLGVRMPAKPRGAEWAASPHVETRVYHEADGRGYIEPGYRHIFVVTADGGTPRQITTGDFNHGAPAWSTDGDALYFSANRGEDAVYQRRESEIYAVSLDGDITQLTDRFGPDSNPAVGDGRIVYTGFDDREQTFQNTNLYVMRPTGGRSRMMDGGDLSFSNPTWADGALFAQFDREGITHVGRFDQGDMQTVASNLGGTAVGRPYGGGNYSVSDDGTVAWTYSTGTHVSDVAVSTGDGLRLLTDLNSDLQAALNPVEAIWSESSFDGRRVQSWIVCPPDFDPTRKYPLLVENHGGPISNYGDRFSAEMQLYASAGYVVLYPNPRGSTSYGEEFANLLYHNYPGQDYDDVMSAVDDVIARGYIDEDRLYVTGGSAGGIMTAWIVGSTDRFAASVVAKPVMNWISKTLVADNWFGYYTYRYEGLPWEEPMNYWKFSPISKVGNITTPTMVLVGTDDRRTPVSESRQLYHALKWRQIDTALVTIPGASHNIAGKPSQLVSKVLYTLAWFEQYGGPPHAR
ncbi:MAG: S9 family peptidase [Rhodothermales bacterium]|nr:S9 family peptidase [Rhodothermales bacterium]MBO6779285.1 S9 family peptidase [Rhodothermales bacterium]